MIRNFKSKQKNTHQDLGAYFLFYTLYLLITFTIVIPLYVVYDNFTSIIFWLVAFLNLFLGIIITWLFAKFHQINGTNPWVYFVEKQTFKNRKGNQNKLVLSTITPHQIQVDQEFDPSAVFYFENANSGAVIGFKVTSSYLSDETWKILESQLKKVNSYHTLILTRQIPETKNKTLEYVRLRNGQKIKNEVIDFIKNDNTESLLNISENYQYFYTYNNLPSLDLRRFLFLNQKINIRGQELTPSDTLGSGEKEQLGKKSSYESSDDDKLRSIKYIHPQIGQFAQKETYIYLIDFQKFETTEKFEHFKSILNSISGLTFKIVPNFEAQTIFYESLLGENPNFLSTITHEKNYSIVTYQDSQKGDNIQSNLYLKPILLSGFESHDELHWLHKLLRKTIVGFNYTSLSYFGLMDKYGKRHVLNEFYKENKEKLKDEKKDVSKDNEKEATKEYNELQKELLKKNHQVFNFGNVLIVKGTSYEHLQINFNYITSEIQKLGFNFTTFDYQMERFFTSMRQGYFNSFSNYTMDTFSLVKASPYLLSGGYSDDAGIIVGSTPVDHYPVKLDFYNFHSDNQIDVNIYKQIYGPHHHATYAAPHLMCIGESGSGKSSLLKRIILESRIRGRKFMILDMENELVVPFKQRLVMGAPDVKVFSFDNSDVLFFSPLSPINPIISSDDNVVNKLIELKKARKNQLAQLKQKQLVEKTSESESIVQISIYNQLEPAHKTIVRKDIINSVKDAFWSLIVIINENNNRVLSEDDKSEWKRIIGDEIDSIYNEYEVQQYIDTGKFVSLSKVSESIYHSIKNENPFQLKILKEILFTLKESNQSNKFIDGDQEIDFDDYNYIIFAMKELNQLLGENKVNDLPFAQLTYQAIINTVRDLMFSHKYYDEGVTFVIDEAHKIFSNNFKGFNEIKGEVQNTLGEIIRQGRKHNSSVYIATQSLREILEMEKVGVPFKDNMTFQFIRTKDKRLLDEFYSDGTQEQEIKKLVQEAGNEPRTFMVYNKTLQRPHYNKIKVFHPHFSAHYSKISGSEIHLPSKSVVQVSDLDLALDPYVVSENSIEYFLLMATVYMLKMYHEKLYNQLKWVDVYENWFGVIKSGDVSQLIGDVEK